MSKKDYFPKGRWTKAFIHLALLSPLTLFASPSFGPKVTDSKDQPFVLNKSLSAQQEISGTVRDKDGNPLAGVTVSVKAEGKSTSTDVNGKFSIAVASNSSVLSFTYVGFESKEVTAGSANSVVLEQSSDVIDEVVVVAYGRQKKSNLTSAVSQVDPKVLQDRPSPTVTNMLQGAAPGLVVTRNSGRPGGQGLNIKLRGETSANGSVNPLIVIDGVISSEETFVAINPSDIENISVLKDGGATAIYGAKSAGGVILVTTKKGAAGTGRISLSSNVGVQSPSAMPDRLSLIDEMKYVNLARANANVGPEYSEDDLNYAVNGPTFVKNKDGQWVTYNQQNILDQVVQKKYNIYNNNIQFSGGSEKITYMASLGNMTQNGMFKVGNDKFSRINARANISAQVNDYLKLDIGNAFINQDTRNPQDGGYGIDGGGNSILRQFYSSRMRFPIYNEDGTYFKSGSSSAFGYAIMKDGGFNNDLKRTYFNNATATINNFVKGLEIKLMYSREHIEQQNRNFRRTVDFYTGPDPKTKSQLNNPNNYSIGNYKQLKQNVQAVVDYNLTVAEKHNFHVMGGFQFYGDEYQYQSASTKNLYVNDNPSLNFTSDPLNKSHSQSAYAEKMQSFFGRFNYNFDEKYLFEATIRSDESSRLSPGKRVQVFPSFSAGWNMTKESWFNEALPIFDEFKPRVSWGKVGSTIGIGYYDFLSQLSTNSNLNIFDLKQTYLWQNALPGDEISWEIIETRNIGLDFSLLNRKLSGTFEYFNKFNNNMLVPVTYPATIGIAVPKSNDGRMKTWGWEASLNYRDKIGDDFNYNVGVSMADNQNKLIKYGGAANTQVYSGINNLVEGYALKSIWVYKTDGYFQNAQELEGAPSYERFINKTGVPGVGDVRYVDVDNDGVITPGDNVLGKTGDMIYLGDTNPRYQYGINAYMGYKNFDFSFFIQGIGKRWLKPSNELIQPQLYSYYLPMDFQMDYWTEENRNAAFPRPYLEGGHNFQNSDKWFLSGAYARLKNVQLGYTLNKDVIKKMPFNRVRLYVSAEDILTVSKLGVFKGALDPEIRPEDNKVSPYPFATTVSFGLNIDL
ncbi:TonB-dependent receptor [Sphingobacterium kyonggiense]|uniref:TonB-dependent receptor n=1 Tax=Sphingobacterium kyonggiense TaxID=714075 RepID=A0ABP7Z1M2_9SPHI